MKQILQSLRSGDPFLAEVPCPIARPGQVTIRTAATLISTGTERMLVDFGRSNYLQKARQQPEKVRMALEKVRTDGFGPTLESVRSKLDQPVPLGYCNAGRVLDVGPGVTAVTPGQRVVSNGFHAEIVQVPQNLCARIPEGVSDGAAAFTVLGAVALQGVRLAAPGLGEWVAVSGLGLIGLLTVQLLRAQGCRVLGLDFDQTRLELARHFGAETVDLSGGGDVVAAAMALTGGRGVDAALLTAATRSSEPVQQAARMCRKRGRLVLVGMTGLELSRDDFYKKELSFQVSCSYGPGRYDDSYESGGHDYPYAYVRWTAQRNFEAFLQLLAEGKLDPAPLISHRFAFSRAADAYRLILGEKPHLGVLLEYPAERGQTAAERRQVTVRLASPTPPAGGPRTPSCGVIGAGQHALKLLLPAFREARAHLGIIADADPVAAGHAAARFHVPLASTDAEAVFSNPELNTVVIATRHNSHAQLVCRALEAGQNVYVEKPLAIRRAELRQICELYASLPNPPLLMVGFNRRFAPHIVRMKQLLSSARAPLSILITVNAGAISPDHWIQAPAVGGGRMIGEGCHFIDLMRFLAGTRIADIAVTSLSADTLSVSLRFGNGSIGSVHYWANGSKDFPKERVEVFCEGRILQLDNFRRLTGFGWKNFGSHNLWSQDKGHRAAVAAFAQAVRTNAPAPIPFEDIVEVTATTFDIAERIGPRV